MPVLRLSAVQWVSGTTTQTMCVKTEMNEHYLPSWRQNLGYSVVILKSVSPTKKSSQFSSGGVMAAFPWCLTSRGASVVSGLESVVDLDCGGLQPLFSKLLLQVCTRVRRLLRNAKCQAVCCRLTAPFCLDCKVFESERERERVKGRRRGGGLSFFQRKSPWRLFILFSVANQDLPSHTHTHTHTVKQREH